MGDRAWARGAAGGLGSSRLRRNVGRTSGTRRGYAQEADQRNRRENGTALEARDDPFVEFKGRRYQVGNIRGYTVKSRLDPAIWPGEIIESTKYPNGNQGDDLRALNIDPSRYVVKSNGCGPNEYILETMAGKGETNGIWVSEHILELNSIGRFMISLLDGGLDGIGFPGQGGAAYLPAFEHHPPVQSVH